MSLINPEKDNVQGFETQNRNVEGTQRYIKEDVTHRGVFQLENKTTAPRSGKLGQLIMLNGELNRWDSGTSAWVVIG